MINDRPLREVDVVEIPEKTASEAGARPRGTVVWYVEGAPFATVECRLLGDDPLRTVLIDVPVVDLRRI